MKSVGIIGAGSFGVFMAEKLEPFVEVKMFSSSGKAGKWAASLEEVGKCDCVIPSIPMEAYEATLSKLKPHLSPKTVIIDVCSVKEEPVEIIQRMLPGQPLVATHPLFGPQSAGESLAGHIMVVCPEVSDKQCLDEIERFSAGVGLKVTKMSVTEHDEEMAVVQGLTFFIAHTLKEMGLHHQKLETPSFRRLLHLAELEANHSEELFRTIQTANQRTKAIRQRFINEATRINHQLNNN